MVPSRRVTTGNTMAPCIIIGERAAEALRHDYRYRLRGFVSKSMRASDIIQKASDCEKSETPRPQQIIT
jgi:choline dehydrogenase